MVALYWLLNRLFTYWFMSEVLPTLGEDRWLLVTQLQLASELDNEPAIAEDDDLG